MHSWLRSCGAAGPVDYAAEDVSSSYGHVDVDDDARIVVGWVLVEALVWTVPVEVAFVLTQHGSGVVFVVDQDPVGALGSDAAGETFDERNTTRPLIRSRLHRTVGIGAGWVRSSDWWWSLPWLDVHGRSMCHRAVGRPSRGIPEASPHLAPVRVAARLRS